MNRKDKGKKEEKELLDLTFVTRFKLKNTIQFPEPC